MARVVPFYPQVWELDEWQALGFPDRETAEYWQNASCGVLALKMGIEGLQQREVNPISHFIAHGLRLEAFDHKTGWSHKGLSRLAGVYGTTGVALSPLTIHDLKQYLDVGCFCIVSIKWAFENKKSLKERLLFWKKEGGHLALVIGYDDRGFYVHHTSVRPEYNWENTRISFQQFEKAYTGRGVVLLPPK